MTDDLPLSVCIDCCLLLNQCSIFYEKSNQAQTSLRELLINPKPELHSVEPNIKYIEKTVHFPKEEQIVEEIVKCNSSNASYNRDTIEVDDSVEIDNSVDVCNGVVIEDTVEIDNNFFSDESIDIKPENYSKIERVQDDEKNENCTSVVKKNSSRQPKKKIRKKNQIQKMEDLELGLTSDLDEELNELDAKSNAKIPENYMTGQ